MFHDILTDYFSPAVLCAFILTWTVTAAQELRLYPGGFREYSQLELHWPVGNSLNLTCEIDAGDPEKYALVWILPHAQVRGGTNISRPSSGRSVLWMNRITPSDSGPYKCQAEKIGNKLSYIKDKTLTLHVASTTGTVTQYLIGGWIYLIVC